MKSNKKISYGQSEVITGGAHYKDSLYTMVSPLVVNEGNYFTLTNNENSVIDINEPSDFIDGMWSSDKLQAVNEKDFFTTEIRFKAKSSVANGRLSIGLWIGSPLGMIRTETFSLHKDADTEDNFARTISYYTGSTFIANGGSFTLSAIKGNISLWDFEVIPFRVHKGY